MAYMSNHHPSCIQNSEQPLMQKVKYKGHVNLKQHVFQQQDHR